MRVRQSLRPEAYGSPPPGGLDTERRRDPVLRTVVDRCDRALALEGFRLEGRGNAEDKSWVRFRRAEDPAAGDDGALVLVVAHGRRERALLVNAYSVEDELSPPTPRARLMQHYRDASELPFCVRRIVHTART